MDIKEFDMILDTLEQFTIVLKKETELVRSRKLAHHQDVIDEKALILARLNDFDQKYGVKDYASLSPSVEHERRYHDIRARFGEAFKENGVALAAANRLYEIMIDTINQAMYEADAKPIGYSLDHGQFKSGRDVYNHVGGAAMKFSEQF